MKFGESRHGNLTIAVPRAPRARLFIASIVTSLGFSAVYLFIAFPDYFRVGGILVAGTAIVLVVWKLLPASTIEFDANHGAVLRDGRRVARFSEIEFVELTVPALEREGPCVVALRLGGANSLVLGYTDDEVEASTAAAKVAGALDRPVRAADA